MTHKYAHVPPHAYVVENYHTDQRIARYRGNALIEALPPIPSEVELFDSLQLRPDFNPEARHWDNHWRISELLGLLNFMLPLSAPIELGMVVHSALREGYVGRRPFSREHVGIFHAINEHARLGTPFRQSPDSVRNSFSTALIGETGMGKTTTLRRIFATMPKLLFHPKYNFYQVSHLHVETPSDGRGVKALALGIISQLDELMPEKHYWKHYVGAGRGSAEGLIRSAAHVMNDHFVGFLVADEIQNIANATKTDRILMAELVSLCNQIRLPQLLVGTPKADRILTREFWQGRRGISLGLGDWDRLPEWDIAHEDGKALQVSGEFSAFINELWQYQWTRNVAALTPTIQKTIYKCTQGVIDLILKLFIIAQARAIFDGSELLTEQLLLDTYTRDMKSVHPMVDSIRAGNYSAMMEFGDVRLPDAREVLDDIKRRYRNVRQPVASVRPGSPDFEPRLEGAMKSLGVSAEDAAQLAKEINEDGTAKNMLQAVVQVTEKLKVPRKQKGNSSAKGSRTSKNGDRPAQEVNYADRPYDLRRALAAADRNGGKVIDNLVALKMTCNVEEVLCRD